VSQDLGDKMNFRMRASYVQRKSANQAAPLPLFVGPDAGNGNLLDTVTVDATNPFNPFGFNLGPGTYAFIGRRLIEGGPRHYEQEVDTWNVTGILSGDFDVAEKTWHWDVNALYSRNHAEQTFTGNVNAQRVQQALGPAALCTGACTPLNIFGGVGTITPAMLQFISFTQHDVSQQELTDVSANLTGDLFQLPAGPLAFAVGAERRRTEGFFSPDSIVAAGLGSDIPAQPTSGKITVKEAYGELRIPLLRDVPFFNRLDASIAGRWFDYSTSGSGDTYKAGITWRPVEELLFRASYGEGYRAPSIGELFGSASRFDQEVVDPCSGFSAATPSNVRANCIARGVPANGSYTQLNPQVSVITSGNQALEPETSKSYNFSGVWEPTFLKDTGWSKNVSLEVAYSRIKLNQAIQAQNGQSLLDRCAQTNDALACATITRSASGQVIGIANPLINIGGIKTRSIDVNFVWTSPEWAFGQFGARWYTTRLLEFTEFVPAAGGLVSIEREGTERGSPDQAYPKLKSTLMLDWDKGAFGATATGRYLSAVQEAGDPNKLERRLYVDAQIRWTPGFLDDDNLRIAVGVNNLFDKDPPGCVTCALNNYDPNAYDAPGRFMYLQLSYRR
jgi:iron complex outermembrane receptor protein